MVIRLFMSAARRDRISQPVRWMGQPAIFTMFLPFRLGDVVRAIVLNELEKAPLWTIATTVLIERIIDVLVTLALFLCLVPFLDLPADIKVVALVLAAMSGGVAVALLVGAYLSKVLPPGHMKALIAPIITQIADALRHLSRQHVALSVIFWTLLGWGIGVFRHWLALMAFVPDATAMESLMLTVMLSLAVAIPSAPGFIGVFQLVGQQALVIPFAAKYDTAIALGVTVVLHLALFIATTVIGVAAMAIISRRIAAKDVIASFGKKAKSFIATAKSGPPDG